MRTDWRADAQMDMLGTVHTVRVPGSKTNNFFWISAACDVEMVLIVIRPDLWPNDLLEKEAYSSLCYKHHTATGTHVPYGITQYYLPPGRGDIPAFTPAN